MKFSKLGNASIKSSPIDPIKIFEALPSLAGTPNDLWRGQAEALEGWHKERGASDVLVQLNTGAGKTIVGLLIAQSLVNEKIENVVYVCSTIDLVKQTAREAERIGIPFTLRIDAEFSNALFESGKAFCITTYAALFNSKSVIQKRFFPGAIIFDDAHVAESILRDAFTLKLSSLEYTALFEEVAELFRDDFKKLGTSERFRDSVSLGEHATSFVPPRVVQEKAEQLLEIFTRHKVQDDKALMFAFGHLRDHISTCAAIFTRGVFELSPPFLPSLALDIFGRKIRRVYLSATMQSVTGFIRAFGRKPSKTIAPSNDAGNGERLILFSNEVKGGFPASYLKGICSSNKVVIAIPSYAQSQKWETVAVPPNVRVFTEELSAFRTATSGAFVLVSRADGIDLPHDTCRIMLIDGIPGASSLIDRYQWEFLKMNNVHATRIANRVAQLFGRINRGRNDYGVFLIDGHDLNVWLAKDRNINLLPPLLQKQLAIGKLVQSGLEIADQEKVSSAIEAVITRNKEWLDFYNGQVNSEMDPDQLERARSAEPYMEEAALAEAKYAAAMWEKDYSRGRIALEEAILNTTNADTPLSGWHNVWIGAALDLENDRESAANAYTVAMSRLGTAIVLPRKSFSLPEGNPLILNEFGKMLQSYLNYSQGGKCLAEIAKLKKQLNLMDSVSTKQAEEGVRTLGEILGFNSTRPDNDQGTGPDVLWVDEHNKSLLALELKTGKNDPATYYKSDVSQGHDHISWVEKTFQDYKSYGLLFVGPEGYAEFNSNPSPDMTVCTMQTLLSLKSKLIALLDDIMNVPPIDRTSRIQTESNGEAWLLSSLVKTLCQKNLQRVTKE